MDRVEKQKQEWQRGFVLAWVCACTGGDTANTAKRNERAEAQRPRREQGTYELQKRKSKSGEEGAQCGIREQSNIIEAVNKEDDSGAERREGG